MRNFLNWAMAFWAFGGAFLAVAEPGLIRSENLPAFCKSLYPKLLPQENRPLSVEEVQDLLKKSQLSPTEFKENLETLSNQEKRALLEKLMLLTWQVGDLPSQYLSPQVMPQSEQVLDAFPRSQSILSQKPELIDPITRLHLKKTVWSAAKEVASNLSQASTPDQQKENFKVLLDHLDAHDLSWYHQSQIDSLIDLASGIQTKEISEKIQKESRREFNDRHQGEETYSFAGPGLLLTPYTEILNLFKAAGLKRGQSVVDLGAGFGRVGLALATQYPDVTVTGYEIVKERIEEGARVAKEWGLDSRVHLLEQNLADPDFKPQAADYYFAFNPVSGSTFDKILEDLRVVGLKSKKRFRLIVFGPSPFFKTDAQPWLKQLTGEGIPQGDELKIYEFDPSLATHTVIADPGHITNPFQLRPASEIPIYPKSQAMTSEHLKTLEDHLAAFPETSSNNNSFLSPKYLTGWAESQPMEISQHGNQLLIQEMHPEQQGREFFFEPFGGTPEEKAKLIKKVIQDKKRQGIKAEFSHLSESVYEILKHDDQISAFERADESDFVYAAKDLASLTRSKKLRERAKQATAFQEASPQASVEFLRNLNPEQASRFQENTKKFIRSWLERTLDQKQMTESERTIFKSESATALFLTEKLVGPQTVQVAVKGADGKIVAYASGEIRISSSGERTLNIYVQKSDGTKNAIPFINRELVNEVVSHPELYGKVEFVNMMDASTAGLRQFKMHYEPDLSRGKNYGASNKEP